MLALLDAASPAPQENRADLNRPAPVTPSDRVSVVPHRGSMLAASPQWAFHSSALLVPRGSAYGRPDGRSLHDRPNPTNHIYAQCARIAREVRRSRRRCSGATKSSSLPIQEGARSSGSRPRFPPPHPRTAEPTRGAWPRDAREVRPKFAAEELLPRAIRDERPS